jgi:small subunit ribosomal protein S11
MSEEAPKTPKAKKPKAPAAEGAAAPEVVAAAAAPAEAAAPERKEITAKELLGEELGEVKVRRAKGSKNITTGICHILATFNNTKVTITDANGNVISWGSAGRHQFRGSRKSTAYAAQVVCSEAAKLAMAHGLKDVSVRVKGPGMGRDSAIRALQVLGLNVTSILDTTPIPHNGCRPPNRAGPSIRHLYQILTNHVSLHRSHHEAQPSLRPEYFPHLQG